MQAEAEARNDGQHVRDMRRIPRSSAAFRRRVPDRLLVAIKEEEACSVLQGRKSREALLLLLQGSQIVATYSYVSRSIFSSSNFPADPVKRQALSRVEAMCGSPITSFLLPNNTHFLPTP